MKNHVKLLYVLVAAVLLTAGGCISNRVYVDYDKQFNFQQIKTYGWLTSEISLSKNPLYSSDLIKKDMKQRIQAELDKRGLKPSSSPDIWITYHIYAVEKTEEYATTMAYPGGFNMGWGYYPYGYTNWPYAYNTNFNTYNYTDGTIIVDLINPKDNMMVWRGSDQQEVTTPQEFNRHIENGIPSIFKKFPAVNGQKIY